MKTNKDIKRARETEIEISTLRGMLNLLAKSEGNYFHEMEKIQSQINFLLGEEN